MVETPRDPAGEDPTHDRADVDPASASAPGVPGWVKAIGIVALILIAFVVVQFVFGVQHGPGMHGPSSGGDRRAPNVVVAADHLDPAGLAAARASVPAIEAASH